MPVKVPYLYVLNEANEPVPEDDVLKWGEAWDKQRFLKTTQLGQGRGKVTSIFLGMDDTMGRSARRMFETAVITDTIRPVRRYATYAECMAGHEEVVKELSANE